MLQQGQHLQTVPIHGLLSLTLVKSCFPPLSWLLRAAVALFPGVKPSGFANESPELTQGSYNQPQVRSLITCGEVVMGSDVGRAPMHFRPRGAAFVCMENMDRWLSFSMEKILYTTCAWL